MEINWNERKTGFPNEAFLLFKVFLFMATNVSSYIYPM